MRLDQKTLANIKEMLARQNLDCALVFSPANSIYLSGYVAGLYSRPVVSIVPVDADPILLVPKLEASRARESIGPERVHDYDDSVDVFEVLRLFFSQNRITRNIGVDLSDLTGNILAKLDESLKGYTIHDISSDLSTMRMIKTDEEIEMIMRAAVIADSATEAFVTAVRPDVSEVALARIVFDRMLQTYEEQFPTFDVGTCEELGQYGIVKVLSGKRTLFPHAFSSAKNVRRNESVVLICIASMNGYLCEEERTVLIQPVSARTINQLQTLIDVRRKVIDTLRPGLTASQVDKMANEMLEEEGLSSLVMHRTGHGIGIAVHERPFLRSNDNTVLKEGMVITIEPGIYPPDFGGMRNSDTVLITENGHKVLTTCNADPLLVT